jgi:sulfatase maturation enzyme AslB (radical SAM superfamily)
MNLSVLYRGPLSSCNYGCTYCPFAKTKNTRDELADDKTKLFRFVKRIKEQTQHQFGILFTPWGEALIRSYYQRAITELSQMPNVRRVAIQTNLTCSTDWLKKVNPEKVALWTTYHPTQITREAFVAKCRELLDLGIRFSVGTVGFKEAIPEIQQLRRELPESVYVWVNATKKQNDYYNEHDAAQLLAVDPLFSWNQKSHESAGEMCRAGETVFSLDGDGAMFRCHFIKQQIGNFYKEDWETALKPRTCTNATCGCHIGYIHMPKLDLYSVYGEGLLERIPG